MAKNYKGIGKGRYKATSGKRKGKVFTMGKGGSHVYKKGSKTVTIHKGGRRTVTRAKGKPKDTFNPLAPRTGKTYEQELKANVDLEFGDDERELATQRRNSAQHMTNVGDWWGGYQRDLEAARQRQLQGGLLAAGMTAQQGNAGFGQDAMQAVGMDIRNNQNAALRGTTTDPKLGQQAMQAASLNRTQTGNLAGVMAGQTANQNAYLSGRVATAGGQRAQSLQDELSKQRKLDEEGRVLAQKKGAYKTKFRGETIDKERNYAAFQKEFGLDVAKEQGDQAKDRADARAKAKSRALTRKRDADLRRDRDRRHKLNVQKHGQAVANEMWDRAHPSKGSKGKKGTGQSAKGYGKTGVTRAKSLSNRGHWEGIVADSKRLNKIPKGAKGYWRNVLSEYARGKGQVSKSTALKVYRLYGIRLKYGKSGQRKTGKTIKRKGKSFKGF